MSQEAFNTYQKALALNLDQKRYGTIAEIGAGQEVGNWFFRVGGAAGTVAKTISAYDMKISDDIYGESQRYVSRERVLDMLDREYELLLNRLSPIRGPHSTFFVFADSISARNYKGTNVCHGWLGIRFQSQPQGASSDVLLHINMSEETNLMQQQAIGVLGINLIYAVFYKMDSIESFLATLHEQLTLTQIDVDYLEFSGAYFTELHANQIGLHLLRAGLTKMVLASAQDKLEAGAEALYKRPLVVARTTQQANDLSNAAIALATAKLQSTLKESDREPLVLVEVALTDSDGELSYENVNARIKAAQSLNCYAILTLLRDQSELTALLQRNTPNSSIASICYLISPVTLLRVFREEIYQHLPGGITQAMARFLSSNVKLYIAPMARGDFDKALVASNAELEHWTISKTDMISLASLEPTTRLRHLFLYLQDLEAIVGIE